MTEGLNAVKRICTGPKKKITHVTLFKNCVNTAGKATVASGASRFPAPDRSLVR